MSLLELTHKATVHSFKNVTATKRIILVEEQPKKQLIFYTTGGSGRGTEYRFLVDIPWMYYGLTGTAPTADDTNSKFNYTFIYIGCAPRKAETPEDRIYAAHQGNVAGWTPCVHTTVKMKGNANEMASLCSVAWWSCPFTNHYVPNQTHAVARKNISDLASTYLSRGLWTNEGKEAWTARGDAAPRSQNERELTNLAFYLAWENLGPESVTGDTVKSTGYSMTAANMLDSMGGRYY